MPPAFADPCFHNPLPAPLPLFLITPINPRYMNVLVLTSNSLSSGIPVFYGRFIFFFHYSNYPEKHSNKSIFFFKSRIRCLFLLCICSAAPHRQHILRPPAPSLPSSWYLSDLMRRDRYHIVLYVHKNKRLGWKPNTKYVLR